MPIRTEHAAPAHLGAVIRAIAESFALAGNATPVLVGEHYASANARGVGSPPHVILVPEPGGGRCKIAPPLENIYAATHVHTCDVIVRAAESGDDITRLDAAYELSDLLASSVRRICAGRVEFGAPIGNYPSPLTSDALGAGLSWSFTFDRGIRGASPIARLAPSTPDTTPARPPTGAGSTGTLHTIEGDAVAAED